MYKVKDQAGESIDGIFYFHELLKVFEPEFYKIEKIIKRRKDNKGNWIYLVKWQGYPEKFNSFVTETDVKSLR